VRSCVFRHNNRASDCYRGSLFGILGGRRESNPQPPVPQTALLKASQLERDLVVRSCCSSCPGGTWYFLQAATGVLDRSVRPVWSAPSLFVPLPQSTNSSVSKRADRASSVCCWLSPVPSSRFHHVDVLIPAVLRWSLLTRGFCFLGALGGTWTSRHILIRSRIRDSSAAAAQGLFARAHSPGRHLFAQPAGSLMRRSSTLASLSCCS
jgi:hypothetical protein